MDAQQIIQVGNSFAITIPKYLMEDFGWKKGNKVYVDPDKINKSFTVATRPPADDSLTKDYYIWKKDFIKKNNELLKKLA